MLAVFRSRSFPRWAVAALTAVLFFAAGIEAVWHEHVPHVQADDTVSVHAADEDGGPWCSFCRLAHQTSPVPSAPWTVGLPDQREGSAPRVPDAPVAVGTGRPFSPRAPPSHSSC